MWRGTRARAPRPAAQRRPPGSHGGFIFAEDPRHDAREARIIWDATLDPGTLEADATPVAPTAIECDSIDRHELSPWLTVVTDISGREHVVLSDGWHHIRLDIVSGSLADGRPVVLRYRLHGIHGAAAKLLSLRRLVDLCRHRRFSPSLFPAERRMGRWLEVLRVHDAVLDGASQREIARVLFGEKRVVAGWTGESASLRSRVRRLIRDAREMSQGGYRKLLGGDLSR